MQSVFRELGYADALIGLEAKVFAGRLAHVLDEVNAVHSFVASGGRGQLTILAMLAEHAGFSLDADILERDLVIQAMINSFVGDEAPRRCDPRHYSLSAPGSAAAPRRNLLGQPPGVI